MTQRHRIFGVFFLVFAFTLQSLSADVKQIGTSQIRSYDNSMINAGTQTWMIDIGANGLAYFANNDGVLEFDGLTWRNYPLPANSVVRSVKATEDGRIYAGGHNEFGFFHISNSGKLVFEPLHQRLPEKYRDFDEIWRIHEHGNSIVFQTFLQLMIYRNDSLLVVEAPEMFHFSYLVNDHLFINDQALGLHKLENDKLVRLKGTEALAGKLIWAMLPKGKDVLIATADEGIFVYDGRSLEAWDNPSSRLLQENQVYVGTAISQDAYAFGTIQDGLIICNANGNLLQHINVEKGLQNNTVLSIHADQFSNLWLGLDNGIDYAAIHSPLTYLSTYNNLSAGYAAVIHNGLLYLGTNRGVFYHDWELLKKGGGDQKFNLISGTQGQVWSLQVIDGSLFCGHNSGIFIIEGTNAKLLSGIQGGWTFLQPEGRSDLVICGTYTCLVKFEKKNGKWSKGIQIKGFKESSRFMANAGGRSIWISHGYKGVFRTHFNESWDSVVHIDFYNSRNGFPSDKDISVFKIFDRVVFTTGVDLFKYDEESDSFVPDPFLKDRFRHTDMNILKEDKQGNVWYFTTQKAGVFRLREDGNFTGVEIPFREMRGKFIKWFQYVYPYNETHVFFATQNGFAHYTPGFFRNYQQSFNAFIRKMEIPGIDSVLFSGSSVANDFYADIPYRFNNLQFEFAANDFTNPGSLSFLLKLEGFDPDWVDWQDLSTRQFTNLRHGSYTLRVKAINLFGVESTEASLKFHIRPPWYLSRYTYFAYAVIALLMIVLIAKYIRYRIEAAKKAFEEEQKQKFAEREIQLQIESLTAEKEIMELRNEKLRSEKIQKDKELANTTMQIIQKSKSLVALKNDLRKLARELGKNPASDHLHSIIRKINRSIDTDKQWEVFESHFENVHEEFLTRLKENYPDLTPRELKLCAYLRLNISSKEIANLMNISVRGVEISRYRLRKKLALDHDTNLTEFIMTY
jgi:DNA-binding CsgD family transcriptional regulator/ligand-binding sensor domain-containing protein